MYPILAISPFILLFYLMVIKKKPATIAAPFTLAVIILLALFVWQMKPYLIGLSIMEGLFITLEIIIIIFGALFLLNILNTAKAFDPIRETIKKITPDIRIQAILIGWFFVSFIEGVAGFGTPAMLAAPLLVMLGFKPIASVAIALIGDSAAVSFGAVGVPITIGIAEGSLIKNSALTATQLHEIALTTSLLHLLAGFFIPLFISLVASRSHTGSIVSGFKITPFALISGFCYLIPAYLATYWLTPEFPALVGGFIGGLLVIILIKLDLFQPKHLIVSKENNTLTKDKTENHLKTIKAFIPYLIVIILLVITRAPFFKWTEKLKETSFDIGQFIGNIDAQINILNSPGLIFFITGLISSIFLGLNSKKIIKSGHLSIKRLKKPTIGLLAILGIVQIFRHSGENLSGLESMPINIAQSLPEIPLLTVFFSPFLGLIGSFIAGSSTVSNLLFASFQTGLAETLGLSFILMLSLQATGSSLGNMIAIHNILTAQTTVGLKDSEGDIIRITLWPALIYASLVGFFSLLLMNLIS